MRILHVNKYLYRRGGAEAYMLDLARLQVEAGHEVAYFAMQHPENIHSQYASYFPSTIELNPPPSGIGQRVRIAGSMIYRHSARRGIEAVIAGFRPDVVHAHNVYHQLSPSVLQASARAGVRTVLTLHDYKLSCPTYRFLDHGNLCEACLGGRFYNAPLRRCNNGSLVASAVVAVESYVHAITKAYGAVSAFICPSRFMFEKMRQAGVFPERLTHLPHFCDFEAIEPASSVGRDFVFAGRLSHEKGVDTLIEAFSHVDGPPRLLVAGDGPERAGLESLATQLGMGDRVRFLGHLSRAELHETIRASAAVVVPSRWYENQPMIVLEAFACARPVIASDLGGLSEMIDDGGTGYLVPHGDAHRLVEVMSGLVTDPAAAHEMGLTARHKAVATYSISQHLASLDRCYRDE